jgi:hypothetical protein
VSLFIVILDRSVRRRRKVFDELPNPQHATPPPEIVAMHKNAILNAQSMISAHTATAAAYPMAKTAILKA